MLESLAYGVPTVFALLLADRGLRRLLRGAPPTDAASQSAVRVVHAAHALAVFLLAGGVVDGCARGESIATDVGWIVVFGTAGLLVFEVAAWLGVRMLAGGAIPQQARAGNLAAATFGAGHVVATGILCASLFGGTSASELGVALAFAVLAQLSLHALVWAFRLLTTYDDAAEVLEQNQGAALAHAGLSVAMALLIAHAADGPWLGLLASLQGYALALLEGLLFYPLRQVLIGCVLLGARPAWRGGVLDRAIAERGDVGAGALEAATYLATALLVRSLG